MQDLQYADEIYLRHDYMYKTEMEDGVEAWKAPKDYTKHVDHWFCHNCVKFDQYDVINRICKWCGVNGRSTWMKELYLKNPRDGEVARLLELMHTQKLDFEREAYRFNPTNIKKAALKEDWEIWEDDGEDVQETVVAVVEQDEEELTADAKKNEQMKALEQSRVNDGRAEIRLLLNADLEDMPMGSMEYNAFVQGFNVHCVRCTGLHERQIKTRAVLEYDNMKDFEPGRFDPESGDAIKPPEPQIEVFFNMLVDRRADDKKQSAEEIERSADNMQDQVIIIR
jgi:hypothetical protein